MRKGKFAKSGMAAKPLALLLALTVLMGAAVGGTLAWLMDDTDPVVNTFTESGIEILLDESKHNDDGTLDPEDRVDGNDNYKMIPGWTIEKDPVVTVKAGSEDCWVFIKLTKSDNADDYLSYTINPDNWVQLLDKDGNAVAGVYRSKNPVKDITADHKIQILGYTDDTGFVANKVFVKETVTEEMMELIDGTEVEGVAEQKKPTLEFTAYAVQLYKSNNVEFDAAEAWEKISESVSNS